MGRKWIPAIVFWVLFAISIALYGRYPWLDTVWYAGCMLFLLAVAGFSLAQIFRRRHATTTISYRGVPRWLERFSLDEDNDKSRTRAAKELE